MQEIEVDAVGAQPAEAPAAGGHRALDRGVVREHLADQEDGVAPAGDRLADELLGGAVRVQLGGVDERHAELETLAERRHLLGAARRILAVAPGRLADRGDRLPRRELNRSHAVVSVGRRRARSSGPRLIAARRALLAAV
jgi:hypothetical protein